jgi:hypothetical protein
LLLLMIAGIIVLAHRAPVVTGQLTEAAGSADAAVGRAGTEPGPRG